MDKTSGKIKHRWKRFQSFSLKLSDVGISFFLLLEVFQDQVLAIANAKLVGGFNPVEKYARQLDHIPWYPFTLSPIITDVEIIPNERKLILEIHPFSTKP